MGRVNGISIAIAVAALAISISTAFALSESPAGGSSPSAASAPPAASSAPPSAPPATKIVPSDETAPASVPNEAGAAGAAAAPAKKPVVHHHVASKPPEVEPANARLRVKSDGWIYSEPSKSSKKIERATTGKFVNVTGSTRYYLQADLKNGKTGYIPVGDVELVKPTDKVFMLTQNASVLDAPSRWGKKVAEVHRPHNVHVTGLALNYVQIKMKNGLVGFIPVTALQ